MIKLSTIQRDALIPTLLIDSPRIELKHGCPRSAILGGVLRGVLQNFSRGGGSREGVKWRTFFPAIFEKTLKTRKKNPKKPQKTL